MADSDSDSVGLVKSSYDDVNTALENLLGNMSEAGSSTNMTQVNAAIAIETRRAEKAEAALQVAVEAATQIPVWMPIPSPSATTPAGYIPANGASFSASQYPQLGSAFPSGSVPDLRGLFIRGLDTTGTIDNVAGGRTILSFEEGSRIAVDQYAGVSALDNVNSYPGGELGGMQALGWDISQNRSESFYGVWGNGVSQENASFQGSNTLALGITRPKNMAWNYVFRAA